jgi:hypothetical protein
VLGFPLEETAIQFVPISVALLTALRVSLRRIAARKTSNPREREP